MNSYSLTHLDDDSLLRNIASIVARDRATTAALLAHIAEIDARKAYRAAGFPSMFWYCVRRLHLSEVGAGKRIHAARAARRFPMLFEAVADGRLHLSAVITLAPRITNSNIEELVAAASHRTRREIETFLAEKFPQPDVPTMIRALPVRTATTPAIGTVSLDLSAVNASPDAECMKEVAPPAIPATIGTVTTPHAPAITPLAPRRYALRLTMDELMHANLRRLQDLLRHQIPSGDPVAIIDRALERLLHETEKRKLGASDHPRVGDASPPNSRHIPNSVKRDVRKRDGDQCSFVSADGHRCESSAFLEFDHMDEVALGGRATADRIRQLCREHNQYMAELTFGAEFMRQKRTRATHPGVC
jgi:hypothetical protein